MPALITVGVILSLIGLAGLTYCMIKAAKAKSARLEGEALTAHLRKLVAVNLGSFFIAVIGLACLIVGMLL